MPSARLERNGLQILSAMTGRILLYLVGIGLLGLGIVLNTRAGLGVGAVSSFPYALSCITPLSLGTCSMLVYIAFIIAQLLIYRKPDQKVVLQIPFSFLMGRIIDLYDKLLALEIDGIAARLFLLVVAIFCSAMGAYLMVAMDMIPNPADGMAKTVGFLLHKGLGQGKLIFDCVMICATAVMTLLISRNIIGIGIGTLISAVLTGTLIRGISKGLDRVVAPILEKSRGSISLSSKIITTGSFAICKFLRG